MTPDENQDSQIVYQKFQQDLSSAIQNEAKILSELGLQLPQNLLTEDIQAWKEFFELILKAYTGGVCDKQLANEMYQSFLQVDKQDYRSVLNRLSNYIDESLDITEQNKIIYEMEKMEAKIAKIMALLTPEQQLEFIKELNNGKVPEEVQAKLALLQEPTITPEEAEAYARLKVADVINRQRRGREKVGLDTRKFNTSLSKQDILNIVDNNDQYTPVEQNNIVPTPQIIKPVLATPQVTATKDEPDNLNPYSNYTAERLVQSEQDGSFVFVEEDLQEPEDLQPAVKLPPSLPNTSSSPAIQNLLSQKQANLSENPISSQARSQVSSSPVTNPARPLPNTKSNLQELLNENKN